MSKDWMIDVLADLRSFAEANKLPVLAEQLDDAIMIAAWELRCVGNRTGMSGTNENEAGSVHRTHQENGYA
jgi:hypothetical protein